jgi:N-acetylglucosamine-6-phosphate deacetylase
MKCNGIDVVTGEHIEISFGCVIDGVDPQISPPADSIFVAPGWIDLQINGFCGVDYNSSAASKPEIARSIRAQFATGVTRFYPTLITGPPQDTLDALRNLAAARATLPEGPAIEGFHMEGPFISPEDGPRGAHPPLWVRPPDLDEYRRWQDAAEGRVRMITLSPEWPGANQFIETVTREGVVASIGHTRATTDELHGAVESGATMSTHLGNGAHPVLQRHPNYIWDQLADDRLAAGFIADGIHLSASFLKVAVRAKGPERSVLVTDAVMPAGCPPGRYRLGQVEVEMYPDQSVRVVGGTRLAGSALRMDQAVARVQKLAGVSLTHAVVMATRNPARVGRIAGRQRGLAVGERADLVRFRVHEATGDLEILETYLSGKRVF